ncbi:myb-related transcription factor, partner of profilin-like isoform X2 [Phaenicophaeus curvirostris]|uniref:myb-related transcription factor, partner of profilin-like isoform X2 n=1 Tax=Phaenicophaeus curvirostris TaxID=33595 RepID=UPI0037F0C21B
MAAGGGGGGVGALGRRGLLKRKPNFTLQEIEILMSEVLKYEQLLFGAAASTVNAYEKQKIWWRITNKINAAGRNQRDIGEVKNRWRGLRRRAGDKISRHRQERLGPPGRGRSGPGNTGNGPGNGSGNGSGNGGHDGPGPHGLKEEVVKEEPVEVKTEPFPSPGATSVPGRGTECRPPHSGLRPPPELCESWNRSPPRPAPPELSLGDLGEQQEPLGSDFPSLLLEHEAEHLKNCGTGEAGPTGTAGLSAGVRDCAHLTPAERRIVQSNERLVQEMRAFRREYAESRRETTSVLRVIAQALGGLSRSLAEIRDLYLREQAVPKP